MRPTKTKQSALRTPLNWILGTEANVRILRELSSVQVPLGRSDIAERTGLTIPGTSAAIEKLCRTGIIELVGTGGQQSVGPRTRHPLWGALRALFHTEEVRVSALLDELRAISVRMEPIRAMWIEGPVAEGSDALNQPVILGFLASSRDISRLNTSLRPEIARIEQDYDVTVELRGRTEADLATLAPEEEHSLQRARSVCGPHPVVYVGGVSERDVQREARRLTSHGAHDEEGLAIASWIAEHLDRDPSLPKRARNWLVHRIHDASEQEGHELMEWLQLLETAKVPRLK